MGTWVWLVRCKSTYLLIYKKYWEILNPISVYKAAKDIGCAPYIAHDIYIGLDRYSEQIKYKSLIAITFWDHIIFDITIGTVTIHTQPLWSSYKYFTKKLCNLWHEINLDIDGTETFLSKIFITTIFSINNRQARKKFEHTLFCSILSRHIQIFWSIPEIADPRY